MRLPLMQNCSQYCSEFLKLNTLPVSLMPCLLSVAAPLLLPLGLHAFAAFPEQSLSKGRVALPNPVAGSSPVGKKYRSDDVG